MGERKDPIPLSAFALQSAVYDRSPSRAFGDVFRNKMELGAVGSLAAKLTRSFSKFFLFLFLGFSGIGCGALGTELS
jgi:hypothetical protein